MMLRNSNILIATDFSPNSDLALKMGKRIQNATGGKITLVHYSGVVLFWDYLSSEAQSKYMSEQYRNDVYNTLSKSMRDQLHRCDVNCESKIAFGDPYQSLQTTIEDTRPDILIMGHGGKKGPLSMGSLTQKMVASTKIPILVVNEERGLQRISGLIDPSTPMYNIVSACEEMASLFSGQSNYISIVPDLPAVGSSFLSRDMSFAFSDEQKKQIISKIETQILQHIEKKTQSKVQVIISQEKIHDALMRTLDAGGTDLAVLAPHNRRGIEKFFIGSVTMRLLERFKGNFLVIPSHE